MNSSENSPSKVESLELHIIIHSLKLQSEHCKYQVQVKCSKEFKKESSKMKRTESSDVIFFESTVDFELKSKEMSSYGVRFRVFEFVDGEARKNGEAFIRGNEFIGDLMEFRDLALQNCSDESGLLCVSITNTKKMLPEVTFPEIALKKNAMAGEEYTGTNESEQGSESRPDLSDIEEEYKEAEEKTGKVEEKTTETQENSKETTVKSPPTTLIRTEPNSQSKTQSLEQSEKKAEIGPGKQKCCCVIS